MGFEKRKREYRLDFAGTDLEGLEIFARGMTTRQLLELEKLRDLVDGDAAGEKATELFEFFVSKIDRWNLEEDGVPVPVSVDALLDLEPGEVFAALDAWKEAVSAVAAPLEQPSSAGSTWVGEPIPMDVSSVPHPNLSVPA